MRIRVPIIIDGQTHQVTLGDLRRLLRAKGEEVARAAAVARIYQREGEEVVEVVTRSDPPPPEPDHE